MRQGGGCGLVVAGLFLLFVALATLGLAVEFVARYWRGILIVLAIGIPGLVLLALSEADKSRMREWWSRPRSQRNVAVGSGIAVVALVLAYFSGVGPLSPPWESDSPRATATSTQGSTDPKTGDVHACEALLRWYDGEGPNPSDERAGRELRAIASRASSDEIEAVLLREAEMWATGVATWTNGAQEVCVRFLAEQ